MEMTTRTRALDKIFKRRDRYDIPDWQRSKVWNKKKKQSLIDTVLRGWKLPKFYFAKIEDQPEQYEVVDGQQRLEAIFDFFSDELELTPEMATKFGGSRYSELPDTVSDNFDDFEIEYDEVTDFKVEELKDFFERLQQGVRLTVSESLNSVHSNLRDFAKRLANHSFFRQKVSLQDTRYAYFDIVSKVAVIEIEGIDAKLRFQELKDTFVSQAKFSKESAVASRIELIFDYLDDVFPIKNPQLRNRTIIQSLATLVSRLIQTGRHEGLEDTVFRFFEQFMSELSKQVELGQNATDTDYISFQKSVSANVKSATQTRQAILLRKLILFNPQIMDIFDPMIVQEAGIKQEIRLTSETIADLVHEINEKYSAMNGTDLFTPTNKTLHALKKIAHMIESPSDYSDLVSNLYFLLCEGPGNRLDSNTPDSFDDVKWLRHGLQHDFDHGRRQNTERKRKKVGETFQKYSVSVSPSTLDPRHFSTVQVKLLKAIKNDLIDIKQSVL